MRNLYDTVAIIACAVLALFIASTSARAETACAPYNQVTVMLTELFGEYLQVAGVSSSQEYLLEVWANTKTGSWTTIIVDTNGIACIIADGAAYEQSTAL